MNAYFFIEYGLRGCYADGNGWIAQVSTRRELKDIIASELSNVDGYGANKKAIAWLANAAWKRLKSKKPARGFLVLPIKPNGCSGYHMGLHIDTSTRADWLEYQETTR